MTPWRLVALVATLLFGAATPVPQLPSRTVDLRQWGYNAPPGPGISYGEFYLPMPLVSVYKNGDVAAGFVTRGGATFGVRGRPTLVLHALRFDSQGNFLSRSKSPTMAWRGNGIFAVGGGDLLVRTPDALTLWSQQGTVLATRNLVDPYTSVEMSPNRETLLLVRPGYDVHLLLAPELTSLKACTDHESVHSISNGGLAIGFHGEPNHVVVSEICGPAQFEYHWTRRNARGATLLDDRRFVIRGPSGIEAVDRDVPLWHDFFGKSEIVQELESDENGTILAVALSKYVGGSDLLDINGHLKTMRIIIYRTSDGRRLAQVVVEHPPRIPSNFFALSRDGSLLAILSDGFLQITALSAQ